MKPKLEQAIESAEASMKSKPERGKNLIMPRGIVLRRFIESDRTVRYIGQYRNPNPAATAHDRPVRTYKVEVFPSAYIDSMFYTVEVRDENNLIAQMSVFRGRKIAEHIGIKALKVYLAHLERSTEHCKERRRRRSEEKRADECK